jgi:hypothetical protein
LEIGIVPPCPGNSTAVVILGLAHLEAARGALAIRRLLDPRRITRRPGLRAIAEQAGLNRFLEAAFGDPRVHHPSYFLFSTNLAAKSSVG